MNRLLIAGAMIAAALPAFAAAGAGSNTLGVNTACRATLSAADARALAAATPNARAFHENYGASISTAVAHANGDGTVAVRVTANDKLQGSTDVGVYTVSLRTGHVTDDDMEPAEDATTAALRSKLMARHCAAK